MGNFRNLVMIGILSWMSFLGALPTSPTVVSGSVTFDTSVPNTLIVNSTSDLSIVNWSSFTVLGYETVIFNLPSSTSSILNRVTGGVLSQIYGFIYASPTETGNGIVYLVNNNGISKGAVATIVTSGFLASTLDVADGDFLGGGNMTFTNSTNQILNNNGSFIADAGDVILLGYQVIHAGNITASQGSASIGAGAEIIFNPTNAQRLQIVQTTGLVKPKGIIDSLSSLFFEKKETAIVPTGITIAYASNINAYQAEVRADGSLSTTAIDYEGSIAVTGTMNNSGNVIFDATGGYNYLNSSIYCQNFDETGGSVMVLGGSIELDRRALFLCSGANGGGQISIGGGLNGVGTPYNSQNTVMQRGALLLGDATLAGDGGQVVIWSDNTTQFYGSIYSRGGKNSGNGGTVQVCGVDALTNQGHIDVSAISGSAGQDLGCP
jgi:filamentous hemagglutinin family protein